MSVQFSLVTSLCTLSLSICVLF